MVEFSHWTFPVFCLRVPATATLILHIHLRMLEVDIEVDTPWINVRDRGSSS